MQNLTSEVLSKKKNFFQLKVCSFGQHYGTKLFKAQDSNKIQNFSRTFQHTQP